MFTKLYNIITPVYYSNVSVTKISVRETLSNDNKIVSYFSRDSTYLKVMKTFLIYFFVKK
jgi:hypothetical protein